MAPACPEADEGPPKQVTGQQPATQVCLVGGSTKTRVNKQ